MDSPFAKLKVVDLKEQLSAKGLSTKGLKKDLIERLEEAMNVDNVSVAEERNAVECSVESGEIRSDIHVDHVTEHDIDKSDYNCIHEEHADETSHEVVESPKIPTESYEAVELDYDEPVVELKENNIELEYNSSEAVPQIGAKRGSSIVKISNLVRPFSLDDIQSLLSKFGFVHTFWIDRLRTVAFAEFDSVEAAQVCIFQLNDMQWPAGIGKKLLVESSDVDAMNAAMNAPVVPIFDHAPARDNVRKPIVASDGVLDQLFRKTKCLPHLYYLPKNIN